MSSENMVRTNTVTSRLAMHGGTPVRTRPFPAVRNASGRMLGNEEIDALRGVIESGVLNGVMGTQVKAFEQSFAELYGVPHAVTCTSGTAALHLAVGALNPEPGDEIITTPISDFGTVIPILMQNAVPVFADVDSATGNLDPKRVEELVSPRTRAIIAVHLFGMPAPVHELAEIARRHDLLLIEDCAQALLARPAEGEPYVGTYGDIGCFSLQQSKHITTGDGGLVITKDANLARRMRLFADKGWPRDGGERTHLFLAPNYRMTELQGAVALAQLPKLPEVVEKRRERARQLNVALSKLDGLEPPTNLSGHALWQYPLVLDPTKAGGDNRRYNTALEAEGVPVMLAYVADLIYRYPVLAEGRTYGMSRYPLTSPPARKDWKYERGLCPEAERMIKETLLVLPWNENYTEEDVDDITTGVAKVHRAFTEHKV